MKLHPIAAFVAALLCLLFISPAAEAATVTRSYKNVATTRCLEWSTNSIRTAKCQRGYDFQDFKVKDVGTNKVRIATLTSGPALCLAAKKPSSASKPGTIYLAVCSSSTRQQWKVTYSGSRIFKNVYSGQCLDSNGAGKVYGLRCNPGNYQRWALA